MFLIDAIKPNVENKFKTCFFTQLFRGGKSFRVGFFSSNIKIIQKINLNVLKSSYNHICMEVLLIELIDYSIIAKYHNKIMYW